MIDARASRNGEDASDVVTALSSNVGALHNHAWLLSADVHRLYGKIDATHRAADPLNRKIETMQCPHSDSSIARPATSSQTGWAVSPKRW